MHRQVTAVVRVGFRATMAAVLAVSTVSFVAPMVAPLDAALTPSAVALANDPAGSETAWMWANPQARSTDPVSDLHVTIQDISVQDISVQDTAIQPNDGQQPNSQQQTGQRVTLRINNTGASASRNLRLSLAYGVPALTAAEVRRAQVLNVGEYPLRTQSVEIPSIPAAASRELSVTIAVDASQAVASDVILGVPQLGEPGTHPVMFVVEGELDGPQRGAEESGTTGGTQGVLAVARATFTQPTTPENSAATAEMSVLLPLTAAVDVAPGGTGNAPVRAPLVLSTEQLSAALAPGGRLRGLLDAYRTSLLSEGGAGLRAASCVVVDPALIDAVSRMATGYEVGSQQTLNAAQQKRLRDSWGEFFGRDAAGTVDGKGAADAQLWLDDLRELVSSGCVLASTYAGADLQAIAATGNAELMRLAVLEGEQIIQEVLGVPVTQRVLLPNSGVLAQEVLDALPRDLGQVTAFVANNSVEVTVPAGEAAVPAGETAAETSVTETALDEEGALVGESAVLSPWNERIVQFTAAAPGTAVSAVRFQGDLGAALAQTGERPSVAAYSNPTQRVDQTAESPAALMSTAIAVTQRLAEAGGPMFVAPPMDWSAGQADAGEFLAFLTTLLADGRAVPAAPLSAAQPRNVIPAQGVPMSPFVDPGEIAAAHVEQVTRAANELGVLTAMMRNDDRLALTREMFTRPLYQDLLRSLSGIGSRNADLWAMNRNAQRQQVRTVEQVTGDLRGLISLVPPGNVFTRTSESSPLPVVARNGLPLPVPVRLSYSTPAMPVAVTQEVQHVIPAEGSLPLSVNTSALGEQEDQMVVDLWLTGQSDTQPQGAVATSKEAAISAPVAVTVQRVAGLSWQVSVAILAALLALGVLAKRLWARRSAAGSARPARADLPGSEA